MTVEAIVSEGVVTYTKSLYQYDKNVRLVLEGIDLPDTYSARVSNDKENGLSVACKGTLDGIKIPDELFVTGRYVYVWVDTNIEGSACQGTLCMVTIPVIPRPVAINAETIPDDEPDPDEEEYYEDDEDENP